MHELAIAQGVLDIVRQSVPEELTPTVRSVRVRVGRLSGVVPESLAFCFGALVADTSLWLAKLNIEQVPTLGQCKDCAERFEIEDVAFICPTCRSTDIRLISGTEMHVVDVELEDEGAEDP